MLSDVLWQVILLPGVATVVVLIGLGRLWQRPEAISRGVVAVALGTGYAVGHVSVIGWPQLTSVGATGWLVHVAALAAVSSVVIGRSKHAVLRWGIHATSALAIAYLVLRVPIGRWPLATSVGVVAMFAVGIVSTRVSFARATSAHPRVGMLLLLALSALFAGVLVMSGSLLMGLLSGVVATTVGACLVTSVVFRGAHDAQSLSVVASLLWALGMIGFLFAEMPIPAAVILAVVPLIWLGVDAACNRARQTSFRLFILRGAAVVVPMALALGLTARAYFAPKADTGTDDSYGYEYDL